jgi:hypothetical protein
MTALNNEVARLLHENHIQINNALAATREAFNPYNASDMKAVLDKQKKSMTDLATKMLFLLRRTQNFKSV